MFSHKFVQHYCTMAQVNGCKSLILQELFSFTDLSFFNQSNVKCRFFNSTNGSFKISGYVLFRYIYGFPGAYYLCVADKKHLSVALTSVCKCIQRVTDAIIRKKNDFIKFPNMAKNRNKSMRISWCTVAFQLLLVL